MKRFVTLGYTDELSFFWKSVTLRSNGSNEDERSLRSGNEECCLNAFVSLVVKRSEVVDMKANRLVKIGSRGSVGATVLVVGAALLTGCDGSGSPATQSVANASTQAAQATTDEADAATPSLTQLTSPVSQAPVARQTQVTVPTQNQMPPRRQAQN
jgi:hypothetical protein